MTHLCPSPPTDPVRGQGFPRRLVPRSCCVFAIHQGRLFQKQAANTCWLLGTSDELASLILSAGQFSIFKQLLCNWATGAFFWLTFVFVKTDKKRLAREMTSASSEIHNNREMEAVCEYLPGCLREGKTKDWFSFGPLKLMHLKKKPNPLCSNFYCLCPSICS